VAVSAFAISVPVKFPDRSGTETIAAIRPQLTVIGAGPKAVALAAKHRVLAEQGFAVPELRVYDGAGIAANWDGEHGYTDGTLQLGTPPEKDVGFPYESRDIENPIVRRRINAAMLAYSWTSFNVQEEKRGLAEWVDRGCRRPPHATWADYLRWVAERVGLEPIPARLERIGVRAGRWRLQFDSGETVSSDGLVITSPGPGKEGIRRFGKEAAIFDGRDFWTARGKEHLKRVSFEGGDVCVIGSGETAAAIVAHLVEVLKYSKIDLVSREGIVFSRGESYEENHQYSDPRDWERFQASVRRKYLERTDRGVFSKACKERIDESDRVETIGGEVALLQGLEDGVVIQFDDREETRGPYALVVDATGFAGDWFTGMMTRAARSALAAALASVRTDPDMACGTPAREGKGIRSSIRRIEASIGWNLEVEGLEPRLHLPMLSGLARGPGFPSLGCLGTLSDRILTAYTGTLPLSAPAALSATPPPASTNGGDPLAEEGRERELILS
jgi:mycobactin lysine-N-oxygenase